MAISRDWMNLEALSVQVEVKIFNQNKNRRAPPITPLQDDAMFG